MATVAVDFDGVLNTYDGWRGEDVLFDPREGVESFLRILSRHYVVHILTTRKPFAVHNWLVEHGLRSYVENITNIKPPAIAYIDDRAIRFEGDYEDVLAVIEVPAHWERSHALPINRRDDEVERLNREIARQKEARQAAESRELELKGQLQYHQAQLNAIRDALRGG